MTEDETFRILRRRPFEEVRREIYVTQCNHFNPEAVSENIKKLNDMGWTFVEIANEYNKRDQFWGENYDH